MEKLIRKGLKSNPKWREKKSYSLKEFISPLHGLLHILGLCFFSLLAKPSEDCHKVALYQYLNFTTANFQSIPCVNDEEKKIFTYSQNGIDNK